MKTETCEQCNGEKIMHLEGYYECADCGHTWADGSNVIRPKTKTVLIKCEVPEDFPINNYIRVATVEISGVDGNGDRYHADYSAEIITPPTEEEIISEVFKRFPANIRMRFAFKIAIAWFKQRLGL